MLGTRKGRRWLGLLALGLLGLGGWIVRSGEQRNSSFPPTPEWVQPNGQVDLSRFPTRIGVVDETGRVVGWMDLREAPFFLVPPPPGTPAPCRYPVRDDRGNLIGYFGSPPDAEPWPELTHPPSDTEPSRARPSCPAPFRFYPLPNSNEPNG